MNRNDSSIVFYDFDSGLGLKTAFKEAQGPDFDYPEFYIKSVDKNGKLIIGFSDELIVFQDLLRTKRLVEVNGEMKIAIEVISNIVED